MLLTDLEAMQMVQEFISNPALHSEAKMSPEHVQSILRVLTLAVAHVAVQKSYQEACRVLTSAGFHYDGLDWVRTDNE